MEYKVLVRNTYFPVCVSFDLCMLWNNRQVFIMVVVHFNFWQSFWQHVYRSRKWDLSLNVDRDQYCSLFQRQFMKIDYFQLGFNIVKLILHPGANSGLPFVFWSPVFIFNGLILHLLLSVLHWSVFSCLSTLYLLKSGKSTIPVMTLATKSVTFKNKEEERLSCLLYNFWLEWKSICLITLTWLSVISNLSPWRLNRGGEEPDTLKEMTF